MRCMTHEPGVVATAPGWNDLSEGQRAAALREVAGRSALDQLCCQPLAGDVARATATDTRDSLEALDHVEWNMLLEPVATITAVPPQLRPGIAAVRADLARTILAAGADEATAERGWKALLLLDRMLLHTRPRKRGGRKAASSLTRTISERIARAKAGEWEALLEASMASAAFARRPEQQQQDLERVARLVGTAVGDGDGRRANQLVRGPVGLATTAAVQQHLPGLFPEPEVPIVMGEVPAPAAEDVATFMEHLEKLCREAPKNRAQGPGRYERWAWMLDADG